VLALTLYRDRFGASPTSTTYYLSDRPRAKVVGGAGVLGQDWLPLVRDWGALSRGLDLLRPGATPATLDLVLTNTAPIGGIVRFTSLLRQGLNTSGADLAFGDAVLSVVFVEGTTEAAIPIAQLLVDDLTSVTEETVTLRCNGRETLLDLQVVSAEYGAASTTVPFWVMELHNDDSKFTMTDPDNTAFVIRSHTDWIGGVHVTPVFEYWVLIHRNFTIHPGSIMRFRLRTGEGTHDTGTPVQNLLGAYAVTLPQTLTELNAITWATKPTLGVQLGSVYNEFSPESAAFDFDLDVSVGALAEDFALAFATPVWMANPGDQNCLIGPADDVPPTRTVRWF
jgi:hypothetical protein